MHLANGTVSNELCTITAAVSTAVVVYAAKRALATSTRPQVAKAAVGAAVVLVAQMIDVSLFGAVSVHMIGAAFLTLLAGPALAVVGMAAVITTQALALNDGGVIALGANIFNMAVVGVGVATLALGLVRDRVTGAAGLLAGASFAAAASVLASVFAMSAELALSGTPLNSVFALTMPAHAPFAAWETACTIVVVLVAAHARVLKPFARSSSS